MLKVGLTGGIGSGKSTVAHYFSELGIPLYFADIEAKKLMNSSKIIHRKLTQRFGEDVYINNKLNRPFLANLIFTNRSHLAFVNSVVHPKVNQHFNRWVKRQKSPYVIQENALLFENNSYLFFDKIITVTAPKEIKINRVIKRDHTTKKMVLDRMNNQLADTEKITKSDYVINNSDLEKTREQVLKIHHLLTKKSS